MQPALESPMPSSQSTNEEDSTEEVGAEQVARDQAPGEQVVNEPFIVEAVQTPNPEFASASSAVPIESVSADQTVTALDAPTASANSSELVGEAAPGSDEIGDIAIPAAASLDDEVEAAFGGLSLDQLLAVDAEQAVSELEPDSRVKATIVRIHGDNVFLSLKGRYEGITSLRQFANPPQLGAVLDVIVKRFNDEDGLHEVSVPGSSIDVADWTDLVSGAVVEARVTGVNTGGLECTVNSIRGFIPASQIDLYRVEQFTDYINQKLQCVVTEANESRQKLVLSRRAILEREKEAKRRELLQSIEPGQTYDGVVTKLMDFGAFVDIGGIDGLVHISKMSWDRISHPSEVFSVGEKIKVKIEKVIEGSGKISLSYRDTLEDPWEDIEQKYPVNSIVRGTVTRIAQFGAFVKLEPGVEGLVHISELAHHRVFAVRNVVNEGDEVEVKILSVDREGQKMSLSIKATQAMPEPRLEPNRKDEEPTEPPRPLAVEPRKEPLKGGRDRKSGGESVGLNW